MYVEIEPYLKRLEDLLEQVNREKQSLLNATSIHDTYFSEEAMAACEKYFGIKECLDEIKAQMKEDSLKQAEHQWWEPSVPENWRKQVKQKKGIKSLFVWKV